MKNFTLIILCILTWTGVQAQVQTEVTFYTTEGDFVVELEDSLAPITAGNFLSLTNAEFYDGVIFHRVISGFVIQGGDPTGTGTGGPGYSIQDEFHPSLDNVMWTVSMANSGPNSGGSQFFFNMTNNTFLDYDVAPLTSAHAVFGKVISGFGVLGAIQQVPVNGNDKPITDVVMDSVRVTVPGILTTIGELENDVLEVSVFPNPTNDFIHVAVAQQSLTSDCRLTVFSSDGKNVIDVKLNDQVTKVGLEALSPGIYLVQVQNDIAQARKTIVVQ